MLEYQWMDKSAPPERDQKMAKTVLVVEDDKAILDILVYKIEEQGYKVLEAIDGENGLDIALNQHPNLILLDLLLPEMSGLDMLGKLRKDKWGKHVPVFVLTNLRENEMIYKSVALKAEAYFIKSDSSLARIATEVKNKLGD